MATPDLLPYAVDPEQIPWERTETDGTRVATLTGTREPGVVFTYAFLLPAGFWDPPHSHVASAHVFVLRGELRLAYGHAFEPERAEHFPAGSFLYVPAGAVHFDGAEQETIIAGVAVGPWSTDYV